ncbi:MAG: response regulator [Pseudomonas sp.]|nr:response regulator [Pseudomonas sp.]
MPEANGDVVASIIRQDRDATIPIIFLSRESNAEKQLLALSRGADGFVQKPLKRGAFIKALKSIISRHTFWVSSRHETRSSGPNAPASKLSGSRATRWGRASAWVRGEVSFRPPENRRSNLAPRRARNLSSKSPASCWICFTQGAAAKHLSKASNCRLV